MQVRSNDTLLELVSTGAVTCNHTEPVPELVKANEKGSEYVPGPYVAVTGPGKVNEKPGVSELASNL